MLSSATAARVAIAGGAAAPKERRILLKAEHLQKTGSFKPRATLSRMAALSADERRRGVITISAGNAAQAYAWAGREAGVPVTVVMPLAAVASKVAACRAYGAEVVLHGEHVGESLERMEALREERSLTFVHPFDDHHVIAGNGSLGLEIVEDVADVDVVVVPVGGGGLVSGVATAIRAVRPGVRVYGVEPVGSDAMSRALQAGQPVQIQPRSVADGLGSPFAGTITSEIARSEVEDIVLVDDATILAGMRFAIERLKQVLEPAGAAGLAAVLAGAIPYRDGDEVCVILSGGNVDPESIGDLLAAAGSLPEPAP